MAPESSGGLPLAPFRNYVLNAMCLNDLPFIKDFYEKAVAAELTRTLHLVCFEFHEGRKVLFPICLFFFAKIQPLTFTGNYFRVKNVMNRTFYMKLINFFPSKAGPVIIAAKDRVYS
jgi:hypothetical protein